MVAAILGGCGGGGATSSVSGSGHDTPDAAVRGYFGALPGFDGTAGTLDGVLQWIAPGERRATRDALTSLGTVLPNARFQFTLADFAVAGVDLRDADHADVHVRGTLTVCQSASLNGSQESTCSPVSLAASAGSTLPCLRVSGQWYVDRLRGVLGAGASSTTTDAPAASGTSSVTGPVVTSATSAASASPSDAATTSYPLRTLYP